MYKVEINIGDYAFSDDEFVTVQTSDFEKAKIIQEFIEFQQEYGWAVDYVAVEEADEESDEDSGDYIYDEDTDTWYWYDEEADAWYVYDEESDDWVEYVEDEESEDEESEDDKTNITTFVITKIDD